MKIVLGRIEKIDFRTSSKNVKVLESLNQLPEVSDKDTIFVATDIDEDLDIIKKRENKIYIPSSKLTTENQDIEGLHVYFDLENYPFYQKAQELLSKGDNSKGVFRYRRMVNKDEGNSLLAEDFYILSSLLGDPEDIKIKQTDSKIIPSHTIITINFGGDKMAHIEYTVTNQERIELEWNGIKNIIAFDSDEMRPILPENNNKLPLAYSVDSIVGFAHKVDESLINRLDYFKKKIEGGTPKWR